jgi:hypothetical protein
MFGWKIKDISRGEVKAIAAEGQALGLSWAAFKVCDGVSSYNLRRAGLGWADDYLPALQTELTLAGIELVGWGYTYGANPVGEAIKAAERVKWLGLRCFLIDAEDEYKKPGMAEAARRYMTTLRAALPGVSIGLSSYRFPNYHREFPWEEFLEACDFHSPQVYWMKAHNAAAQLRQSIGELRALEKNLGLAELPVVPAGAAFHQDGWQPTPDEMNEFFEEALKMELPALLWWEWGHAQRYGFIPTLEEHRWPVEPPPPPPPAATLEERVGGLEIRTARLESEAERHEWNI